DNAAAARVQLVERSREADGRATAFRIEVSLQASAVEIRDHAGIQRQLQRDEVRLAGPVVDKDHGRGAADLGVGSLGREGADAAGDKEDRPADRVWWQRAAAVGIGGGPAQLPFDWTAVGADERSDVG